MRIGIDISPLRRPRTGVGNYCYYLIKHLLLQHPELDLRGFASGSAPLDLDDLASLPYRYIKIPTRALYAFSRVTGLPHVDSLLGGLDVYHATNYYLLNTRSARSAVTIHDLSFLSMPETSSPKIRKLFSASVPRFARSADAVIACSRSTANDITRFTGIDPAKVTVVYEAADECLVPWERGKAARHIAAKYNVETPFLLFVGTLEPRKNLPRLIQAFSRVRKCIPQKLVLAGPDGWMIEEVNAAISASGIGDRIARVGYVASVNDIAAFYSAADAFLFPSLYEGFGLPLLEAMKCGCPVVCANNSSLPEVAGEAALYVDAEDVDALAAAIEKAAADDAVRQDLAAKGRIQVTKFSWASCADETAAIYRRLAEA
jgi:glycosyltransferase involved in cell wall biosynthesis